MKQDNSEATQDPTPAVSAQILQAACYPTAATRTPSVTAVTRVTVRTWATDTTGGIIQEEAEGMSAVFRTKSKCREQWSRKFSR